MNNEKIISFYFCPVASRNLYKAQDPHFSQFFASPLTLNPAFTGKFNGTMEAWLPITVINGLLFQKHM